MNLDGIIENICKTMPEWAKKRATAFNAILRYRLEISGCKVRDEVEVPNRGDGRKGKVDLVIDEPEKIAIEVDRRSVRQKSIFKMAQLTEHKPMSILREPKE